MHLYACASGRVILLASFTPHSSARQAARFMRREGRGRIINFGDAPGRVIRYWR